MDAIFWTVKNFSKNEIVWYYTNGLHRVLTNLDVALGQKASTILGRCCDTLNGPGQHMNLTLWIPILTQLTVHFWSYSQARVTFPTVKRINQFRL